MRGKCPLIWSPRAATSLCGWSYAPFSAMSPPAFTSRIYRMANGKQRGITAQKPPTRLPPTPAAPWYLLKWAGGRGSRPHHFSPRKPTGATQKARIESLFAQLRVYGFWGGEMAAQTTSEKWPFVPPKVGSRPLRWRLSPHDSPPMGHAVFIRHRLPKAASKCRLRIYWPCAGNALLRL